MRCDKKRPYRDFVCGWGAAFIEMSLTFPLNKLIFRQQLFNISAGQAAGQIRSEGIRFLYRGLLPPLCQKAASRSIMFGMFDRFSTMAGCKNGTEKYFTPCHAFCALLAGTSEAVLVPFERVQTLMQCQRYHNHFKNTFHAFVEVKKFGYREFYRGLTAVLLRNGPCNVLFFGLRQPIHDRVMWLSGRLPGARLHSGGYFTEFVSHFSAGAVLGASISTLAYPLNVAKAHMQSKLGGKFETFASVFRLILAQRDFKFSKIFRGAHLNYTRSLLTWGLTNSLYELLKKILFDHR